MRLFFLISFLLSLGSAFSQGNIVVQGYWKNAGTKEISLEFLEDAIISKEITFTSAIDSLSGAFRFSIPADRPTKLHLFNHFLLALPNDTISISVDKNAEGSPTINFTGSIEKEDSFFPLLKRSIKPFFARDFSFEKSSILDYKRDANAHYKAVIDLLDAHSLHYSSEGKSLIKALITMEYYEDIIYPIMYGKIIKGQLPPSYFEEMDIALLSKVDLLGFREYILFLSHFNICFYGTPPPKGKYYDSAYVNNSIISAQANFTGDVRDNLMLYIYNELVNRGTKKNRAQVEGLYKSLALAFKNNPTRLKQIDDLKHKFDILGKPLPEAILSLQLKSAQRTNVLLSKALPHDKIIYIDFWASWCGPCMAEMPKEDQLVSELKSNDVEFVFISLDKDEEAWQKAMKKINIKENHYQLPKVFKSELMKYLDCRGIPLYIVIDKNGSLVSYSAPRPSTILEDKSKLLSLVK